LFRTFHKWFGVSACGACAERMARLDLGELGDLDDKLVGEIINVFAQKLVKWHALPVRADQLTFLVLASTLAHHKDVIEFCLPLQLARAASKNLSTITPSAEESNFLVSKVSKRISGKSKATQLLNSNIFRERAERVQNALSCTFAEHSNRKLWEMPIVKVSSVLAFQLAHSPVGCLEQIFGALVRSDLRRCDDLHEREALDPVDTVVLGEMLECAAFALSS
jgi:hypothetical protein